MEEENNCLAVDEVSIITYRSFVLQGKIEGSDIVSYKDSKLNGVCQIRVAGEEGGRDKSRGTGFLCKINERYGLLTCYHVMADIFRGASSEANTDRIFLKFPTIDGEIPLSNILNANIAPIKDLFWDIYFGEISEKFKADIESHQVKFSEPGININNNNMIWIPQYAGCKGILQLSSGLLDYTFGSDSIFHKASTDTGSGGAPLLQMFENELRVIGMHKGHSPKGINMAIHIARILKCIPPNAVVGAASGSSEKPVEKPSEKQVKCMKLLIYTAEHY